MGVPKLFHSLIQQYHHNDTSNPTGYYIIRKDIDNGLPIHLYFDFNSAIYQVLKPEIKTEDTLITHVVAYLDSLCNAIGTDKCALVYIALDGVPPMGKIHQQRIRRFHSICRNNRMRKINSNVGNMGSVAGVCNVARVDNSREGGEIDTNMITPGTAFMHSLGLAIKKYILERTASNPGKIKYIFSDSSIPGEGEHKLIHHIREAKRLRIDGTPEDRILYGKEHNTVIYALDNDLIMLALTLGIDNLYLFRESAEYGQFAMIHEGRRYLFMDISELEEALIQNFRETYGCSKIETAAEKRRYLEDYVFLGMLLGNDFMPKTHWFSIAEGGFERLLSAYWQIHNHTEAYMIDRATMIINTEMLCDMMYLIKEQEQEAVESLFAKRRRAKIHIRNDCTEQERQVLLMDFYPLQHLHIERAIDPWRAGWRERYYKICFNMDSTQSDNLAMITQSYLKTLVWNFHYYFNTCISWDWAYTFPYAPSWHDIYNELVMHKNINVSSGGSGSGSGSSAKKLFHFAPSKPIDSQTLLLMVLPWASKRYMASSIAKKLEENDCPMRVYFPKKYGLNVAFHRFYHECTPIIYKMDLGKVAKFIKSCNLTEDELKRNLEGKVYP
jgi:5'-3' exonuclease